VWDKENANNAAPSDLFPREFLEETRRTLSLLVPPSAGRWLKRQQASNAVIDGRAGCCRYLRTEDRKIERFDYWRDRLIILKEAYDDHEPQGLRQFWRDDRKIREWWTFWIAVVVFIVAVIQCVEGALQVYKAYYPS
jgi:hypothetical protein